MRTDQYHQNQKAQLLHSVSLVFINDELKQLTPASAAPPTAASGAGAKPLHELEAFVMLLVLTL